MGIIPWLHRLDFPSKPFSLLPSMLACIEQIECDLALSALLSKTIFAVNSRQNVVRRVSPQQILTTVMTNTVVDKSAENAKPHSLCFLPQYQRQRKFLQLSKFPRAD